MHLIYSITSSDEKHKNDLHYSLFEIFIIQKIE